MWFTSGVHVVEGRGDKVLQTKWVLEELSLNRMNDLEMGCFKVVRLAETEACVLSGVKSNSIIHFDRQTIAEHSSKIQDLS